MNNCDKKAFVDLNYKYTNVVGHCVEDRLIYISRTVHIALYL